MIVNKRKKNSRQRGSMTHGWGAKKKHRGAGNRGGTGKAGTGKRADSKKSKIWHEKKYFGRHGFKKKGILEAMSAINIQKLEEIADDLVEQGKAKKDGDAISINLKEIKFNKLLSTGKSKRKLNITVDYASQKAVDKIQESGGSVVVKEAVKEVKETGK